MRSILFINTFFCALLACSDKHTETKDNYIIAAGQMPAVAKDKKNNFHLVFGIGDSIMYSSSTDNGYSFSNPVLISVLPHVFDFAMRGPQIAVTESGIVVTACTSAGDIYSFFKTQTDSWQQGQKVNDMDTVAKEGLMALGADGNNAFAVWLDLRGNKRNKIYGAKSIDGGRTWLKNVLVYSSPDSTVCECCKPSVVVRQNNVNVMFRNWLNGNRDLYLIQSKDGGNSFENAQKLGLGNWKLDGCPMDGGNLAVNGKGEIHTIWKRDAKIFTAIPGKPEKEIGEGRGCTIETVNDNVIYAWSENGQIVVTGFDGQKKLLGKGMLPALKAIDDKHAMCIWEDNKQIHASVFQL